jgi:molybdenum cofactor cytidylyltransferase
VIPGVILAAGRSERMGRPKALLPCGAGGETFVARLIASLRTGGADDVLVIGRTGDAGLATEVMRCTARFIENVDADRGQLSSLLTGLNAADRPGVHGVLVTPVDIPLVQPATVSAVISTFVRVNALIARAAYRGRHGHPVVFGRGIFDELRRADPAEGARAVLHAHAGQIVNVDVDDEAILRDVDTLEDYQQLFHMSIDE